MPAFMNALTANTPPNTTSVASSIQNMRLREDTGLLRFGATAMTDLLELTCRRAARRLVAG
jgi:hypothetical protein